MRDLQELEKYRDYASELVVYGRPLSDQLRKIGGMFTIPTKGARKGMKVVASSGLAPGSGGWDHVSISLPNRCPTWEEMCLVKDLFFLPDEVCMQLHPAQSENVSNHKYCLHIWRNMYQPILLPPAEMVGLKDMGTLTPGAMNQEFLHSAQEEAFRRITG